MKCASFLISFAFLGHIPSALCVCYNPDGSIAADTFVPCQQNGSVISMCCALDRPNPPGGLLSDGYTQDICLSNGLCRNNFETTNSSGQLIPGTTFWRESCSSPDWSKCLSICFDEQVRVWKTKIFLRVPVLLK